MEQVDAKQHDVSDALQRQAAFRDIAIKYATAPVILCGLASEGNLEKMKQLLDTSKTADVNSGDYDGRTPLHLAAEEGHVEMVKFLIRKGANVNAADRWGTTPLRGAVSHLREEVAEVLRAHGANIRMDDKGKNYVSSARMVAKAEEIERMRMQFSAIAGDSAGPETGRVKLDVFRKHLKAEYGLLYSSNPLLRRELEAIASPDGFIEWARYMKVLESEDDSLIQRALQNRLVVPNWKKFCEQTIKMFESVRNDCPTENANNADYIPELAVVDPAHYGISIMTVDGQTLSYGDSRIDFPVESSGKPLLYSAVSEELGADYIHRFVGREPSGRRFNAFSLNDQNKPHNPLINAGAIMTSSLFRQGLNLSRKFNELRKDVSAMAGGMKIGFSQGVYLSERDTAYRNFALANYMKSQGGFPDGVDIHEATDFYLQLCSLEVNCEVLASCGATYANNGVSPITGTKVMSFETVKNTLQIMYSCGMYDYSGEWACTIGLPGKSGVSGCIFIVIPNVLGLCIWSPPLDRIGNSYRGIEFSRRFATHFKWSIFDVLFRAEADGEKPDEQQPPQQSQQSPQPPQQQPQKNSEKKLE